MDKNILSRLRRLESQTPGRLIAEFTNVHTGEVRTMPLKDAISDFGSWNFGRIVGGDSVRELDDYFTAFTQYVKEVGADGL